MDWNHPQIIDDRLDSPSLGYPILIWKIPLAADCCAVHFYQVLVLPVNASTGKRRIPKNLRRTSREFF